MNHGNIGGRMRMRIAFGRLAVRGPARMPDAAMACERISAQPHFQILELAFGTTAIEMIALERCDACGVVAAIFQALERIHQLLRDGSASQDADDTAHAGQYPRIEL